MAPPCKKIKYKEKRKSKPVVKVKKKIEPLPVVPESPPSVSEDLQPFTAAEEIYEEPKPILPTVSPLQGLRMWLQKQRFLPQDLSDDFLMFFLSVSGYYLEQAEMRLEKYFQLRQEPSQLFRDRDPLSPENVKIFKKLYVLPMPDTTEDGRKIILTGLSQQTVNYNQMEHLKALTMVFDLLIWEKDFGFGDYVIVLDGRGFQCPQLIENKVYNHRSIKNLLLDAIPGTLRSFFLLYPPPHVAHIADNRNGIWITVIKTKQEMISHLPADVLPLEYGGNLGHLGDLLEQWELHMVQSRDFFIHFEKKMINDYRRKLCYEQQLANRGENWVQEMKLEADEWEYKVEYYKKLKNLQRLRHPAFGSQRKLKLVKEKCKPCVSTSLYNRCLQLAKEEEEAAKLFQPTPFYNGYATEVKKARMEAEREKALKCRAQNPILELQIYYS